MAILPWLLRPTAESLAESTSQPAKGPRGKESISEFSSAAVTVADHPGPPYMPKAPTDLNGSLEALHNVSEATPPEAMPRVDLDTPLNAPKQEKWWYEVRRICLSTALTCLPSASPAAEPAPDRTERVPPLTHTGLPQENPEQGLQRMGCWGKKLDQEGCCSGGLFGGVIDDYRRRLPQYGKDITQGITPKTLSSALFMFFATFFSTASLGALIQKATNKRIGLEEYLLMNAIAGMTHALFGCQASLNGVLDFISACVRPAALFFPRDLFRLTEQSAVCAGSQPLLVLRPTGPITAICTLLSVYADKFELDFNQYLGATVRPPFWALPPRDPGGHGADRMFARCAYRYGVGFFRRAVHDDHCLH
jgi:hypothetical protein|eukprot:COSAG06_NODE_4812_length_3937_cov_2.416102_2_plen_364_part_00